MLSIPLGPGKVVLMVSRNLIVKLIIIDNMVIKISIVDKINICIGYLYLCGLPAFLALDLKISNDLAFSKIFKTFKQNRTIMDKDILPFGAEDESISFLSVEPLNGSLFSVTQD